MSSDSPEPVAGGPERRTLARLAQMQQDHAAAHQQIAGQLQQIAAQLDAVATANPGAPATALAPIALALRSLIS